MDPLGSLQSWIEGRVPGGRGNEIRGLKGRGGKKEVGGREKRKERNIPHTFKTKMPPLAVNFTARAVLSNVDDFVTL